MKWFMWIASKYVSWMPLSLLRWYWRQDPGAQTHLSPDEHFKLLQSVASNAKPHQKEEGLFDNENSVRLWLSTSRECFRDGVEGAVQDSLRLGSDWGFRIEDIRKDLPVFLWYGTFDEIAPPKHAEQFAARLGNNARLRLMNETHGSMFANQPRQYLSEIVRYMRANADASR